MQIPIGSLLPLYYLFKSGAILYVDQLSEYSRASINYQHYIEAMKILNANIKDECINIKMYASLEIFEQYGLELLCGKIELHKDNLYITNFFHKASHWYYDFLIQNEKEIKEYNRNSYGDGRKFQRIS